MSASANLNVMIKTARRVGRSLLRDFSEIENLQGSVKGPAEFVNKAERQATDVVRDLLMEARPSYGLLSSSAPEIEGGDPTRRWIVAVLDGRENFTHGIPHWAVSIALEHKGAIIAGVTFDAVKDECYFAEKGEGAFMNERRIRVSARQKMGESVFATRLPAGGAAHLPSMLRDAGQLLPVCAGLHQWGAATLNMAFVASGRFEGFWDRNLQPWQLASGIVILKEAGGFAEAIDEREDPLQSGDVICANDPIFPQLVKVIRARNS